MTRNGSCYISRLLGANGPARPDGSPYRDRRLRSSGDGVRGSRPEKTAADCHRTVIEFVHQHPEQYEPDFERAFQGWFAELDPPAAT